MFKIKKILFGLFILLVVISSTACNKETKKESVLNDVKITKNETSKIEYEDFNNGLVSMKIPKGWKVDVGPFDYIHYTFMAYNPENPSYRIYFNMKSEGYLKTKKMRDWYKNLYPTSPFALMPYIDPQTTEKFYQVFTEAMSLNDQTKFKFPVIKDFKQVERIGINLTAGDIIRGNYKDENGNLIDGIFSATIKEVSLYYVTALNVYTTIFYTTPDGMLPEWENILNYCVSTITFSEKYIKGFNEQEKIIMTTISANQKIYDEMTESITRGWENRQSTYDIISQKQSDATLGYERVYDTETNEIYKAYNGFTDDYKGERYKSVTDNMYNLPTAGYIEK